MKSMEDFFESVLNNTLIEDKINDQFFSFPEKFGVAQLTARQDLVLSGTPLFGFFINQIDTGINYEEYFTSGQEVLRGQSVSQVDGNLISLLKLQRTSLGLLELFSGLATQTRKFVKACQKSQTRVLENCKPLPGYDPWYKQAMKDGGAVEHPSPMKNHFIMDQKYIHTAGGLKQAIINFRNRNIPVTVEVKNPGEIKTACEAGVNYIRFKNENKQILRENLNLIPENIKTEICGHICLESVPEIIKLGVNFINLESLTHFFQSRKF